MTKTGKFQVLTGSGDHSAVWLIKCKMMGWTQMNVSCRNASSFADIMNTIEVICFLKKYPEEVKVIEDTYEDIIVIEDFV